MVQWVREESLLWKQEDLGSSSQLPCDSHVSPELNRDMWVPGACWPNSLLQSQQSTPSVTEEGSWCPLTSTRKFTVAHTPHIRVPHTPQTHIPEEEREKEVIQGSGASFPSMSPERLGNSGQLTPT